MGKIKFQNRWLHIKDCNSNIISEWAVQTENDVYSCCCRVCSVTFSSAKGLQSLEQHANTTKHKNNLVKIEAGQLQLNKPISQDATRRDHTKQQLVVLYNPREASCKAELLWCIENVISGSSVNSCGGKKELFEAMFPQGVSPSFSLSPTKAQYLITEALRPYFKNILLSELQHVGTYFSLQYDETSNVESKKELQIRVRFWSNVEEVVVDRHLITYFIGKADGDTLFKYLLEALDSHCLLLKHILMIGCDRPNVNKKVVRLFKEKLKEQQLKPIVDIGSCHLHTVHNAFLKGLNCISIDISGFIIKVYYFFHKRDLRTEDFEKIQQNLKFPRHKLIKHVATRWLTIGPAAKRIIEQFSALEENFLKFVPKKQESTTKKQSYLDIRAYLNNKCLKVSLLFGIYLAEIFTTEFTLIMQRAEPLIHILYRQLEKIVTILLSNITKPGIVQNIDDLDTLLNDNSSLLETLEVNCGEGVKEYSKHLPVKEKLYFMNDVKKCYIAVIKHIENKAMSFQQLKYFSCLVPENIKHHNSCNNIINIAKILPVEVDIDRLPIEWKLLQIDDEVIFNLRSNERIDSYWNKITSLKNGLDLRYPVIKKVIRAALSLVHGSADVERGFSKSGQLLTEDKARMHERTLNAKLAIVDGMKRYKNRVHLVEITKDLFKLGRNAHASYLSYLEKEKQDKEEVRQKMLDKSKRAELKETLQNMEKDKNTIKKLESELREADVLCKDAERTADGMQTEITKVLSDATNSKDYTKTIIINEMYQSLERWRKKERDSRNSVNNLRNKIEKRKTCMIEFVINNKKLKVSDDA